ncbi:myosin-M heavy protein [Thalictrum thalictroides]|uniref:Myosin-M heavy protein n=1 Tax=Thalictrum thalictroides TaxID=46969 RepID=A0A7J6V5A8_THATH|nr:myosin-M heavy protein [Thalictrum thalictroides]
MSKQAKSKKKEKFGKGKVTPVQVAYMVDRYLSDNNFTETRSTFRTEASSLMSKAKVAEAPKSLLSLDSILDEYICLKEQKVLMEQEKFQVVQEKTRVGMLLQDIQSLMQAFNDSSRNISLPSGSILVCKSMDLVPQPNPNFGSSPGYARNTTPSMNCSNVNSPIFSTPSTNIPSQNKRKGSRIVSDTPSAAKRQCTQVNKKASLVAGTKTTFQAHNTTSTQGMVKQKVSLFQSSSQTDSAVLCCAGGSSVTESSAARSCKQSSPSLQSCSPSPKTPPQACISQIDNSVSPSENSSLVNSNCSNTPLDITPSNCAVISSSTRTVMVSPKNLACYSMERSHYISSSPAKSQLKRAATRDHVKGRLDFGASGVPTSSNQPMTADIPSSGDHEDVFEMPNLDIFGPDFSLSEFLVDIDLNCSHGMNTATSRSQQEPGFVNLEASHSFPEVPPSVTEILSQKDMNIQGQDSSTLVKSITKCVTFRSPVACDNGLFDLHRFDAVIYVWNPSTKEYITIQPRPVPYHFPLYMQYAFGYHPGTNEYKLIRYATKFSEDTRLHVSVLTLGRGNSWRVILEDSDSPYTLLELTGFNSPLVNGALHWVGIRTEDYNTEELGGLLCLTCGHVHDEELHVWVMKEYGIITSWVKQYVLKDYFKLIDEVQPLYIIDDGELLLNNYFKNLIVYDPRCNSFKEID